jgi:hypothetical protein
VAVPPRNPSPLPCTVLPLQGGTQGANGKRPLRYFEMPLDSQLGAVGKRARVGAAAGGKAQDSDVATASLEGEAAGVKGGEGVSVSRRRSSGVLPAFLLHGDFSPQ